MRNCIASLQIRERAQAAWHREGDRVSIYMPMVPELAIAMLACARIGAVHSVIFDRLLAEALLTATGMRRQVRLRQTPVGGAQGVAIEATVDEALAKSPTVESALYFVADGGRRNAGEQQSTCRPSRFFGARIDERRRRGVPGYVRWTAKPALHLYTSGSTGKPKGIKHTTAGYNLYAKKTFNGVSIIVMTTSSGTADIAGYGAQHMWCSGPLSQARRS